MNFSHIGVRDLAKRAVFVVDADGTVTFALDTHDYNITNNASVAANATLQLTDAQGRLAANELLVQGRLQGIGTLTGTVSIDAGGTLAPGNSPGQLTIDGDLFADGTLEFEIDGTNPGDFDSLVVSGDAHLDGTLRLIMGYEVQPGDSFQILTVGGAIHETNLTIELAGTPLSPSLDWDLSQLANSGMITAVIPEPTTGLLVLAGVWGLLSRRVRTGGDCR